MCVCELQIAICFPALKQMGYGITFPDAMVMTYGGLRGAIGIALALLTKLDDFGEDSAHVKEFKLVFFCVKFLIVCLIFIALISQNKNKKTKTNIHRDKVMFHTTGIVFLTLVINATTIKFMVQYYEMDQPKEEAKEILSNAFEHLRRSTQIHIAGLKEDFNYTGADWKEVNVLLPNYSEMMHDKDLTKRHKKERSQLKK